MVVKYSSEGDRISFSASQSKRILSKYVFTYLIPNFQNTFLNYLIRNVYLDLINGVVVENCWLKNFIGRFVGCEATSCQRN